MFGISRELDAFWAGVCLLVLLAIYFFITHVQEDGGPERWRRWLTAFIMWSDQREKRRRSSGMQSVYIPVSQYGMDAGGMESDEAPAPDIDAVNTDMPRVSNKLTDNEMIVLLAAQRGKDNKHRYSANAIHALVGGDRNAVLATIKTIRDVPPPALFRQPDGSTAPAQHPITSHP